MVSDVARIIATAAAGARDFVAETHRSMAAWWPHGAVGSSPAPVGDELKAISLMLDIPWPMTGGAPMSDQTFRELLKKPFTYHSHFGTRAGLLAAVEALGYQGVIYVDWTDLVNCPTTLVGGLPVANQNAFGLICPSFPTDWYLATGAIPTPGAAIGIPTAGTPLRLLWDTVMRYKRASATFWEMRKMDNIVVTQTSHDPVRTQSSSDPTPNLVTTVL